jgi:hypothetical protein
MNTIDNLKSKAVGDIMNTVSEYISSIYKVTAEPEILIENMRNIISEYDKELEEIKIRKENKVMEILNDTINHEYMKSMTKFVISVDAQVRFPGYVFGKALFLNEDNTCSLSSYELQKLAVEHWQDKVWEGNSITGALSQKELMDFLGDEFIEFLMKNDIDLFWDSTLLDVHDDYPEEIDLFFGEDYGS